MIKQLKMQETELLLDLHIIDHVLEDLKGKEESMAKRGAPTVSRGAVYQ